MTAEVKSSNSKKRSAAYYREYRRKRKAQTAKAIPLPLRATHKPGSTTCGYNGRSLQHVLILLFVVVMTVLLIHLSAPFYMKGQSPLMAYILATAVELSLFFLITMKVEGFLEKLAKRSLVLALSAYAILPVSLNPIFEAQRGVSVAQAKVQQAEQKATSLRSEIQSHNSRIQILIERGRITAAQTELQAVAQLENELRNTVATLQPVATSHLELHASYLLALQRLLLMMCNLFLAHRLSRQWQSNRKRGGKITHSWSFPIGIGCAA